MTKRAAAKAGKDRPLLVEAVRGETEAATMARALVAPFLRHGFLANGIADKAMGKVPGDPRFGDYATELKSRAANASEGDLRLATELLTAQALSLDAIFAEMARRSILNVGDYFDASERYMRLALKAQANCRATIEALARLHQPREQTVKHVHVSDGGHAVVAEQFHHHTGGPKKCGNGQTIPCNRSGWRTPRAAWPRRARERNANPPQ